ncbi:MAG: N-formylglutamate deformylase [Rhodospirillales bacterium]|nr:N-formylglutamate deformylase [Rhodospirillales bacterium]
MDAFTFTPGTTPLIVGMPHAGFGLPDSIAATMTPEALLQMDSGWHEERLYDFARGLGAAAIASTYSRYVIDLNRSPDNENRFAGKGNTGLCPVERFDYAPLYRDGLAPDSAEIERRLALYWRPYHDRLAEELQSLKSRFGVAVLFDAHTIRSEVGRLFAGRVPDLNLKSGGGTKGSPELVQRLAAICAGDPRYTWVVDGQYKGGYIVHHYGDPANGIHSLQLEAVQATFMDETTLAYVPEKAEDIRRILKALLGEIIEWAATQGRRRG